MPDLVRVKDPVSGHEYTTSRAHAQDAGLTILSGKAGSAVDEANFGHGLPAKYHTDLAGEPAAPAAGQSTPSTSRTAS